MGVKGRKRSRGSDVEIQVFMDLLGLVTLDDIDSCEVTVNDTISKIRPLGSTLVTHDIEYGDFTIELKCGKTGSELARVAKFVEDYAKKGLGTPNGYLTITTKARENEDSYEVVRYSECVFQFRNTSHQPEAEVTQSVTITASERTFEEFMNPLT